MLWCPLIHGFYILVNLIYNEVENRKLEKKVKLEKVKGREGGDDVTGRKW